MSKPTYVITDYGVVADSDALQTEAVQKVLDLCREGGGTVVVPAGSFVVASLRMWSDTTLYLRAGAKLLGSEECTDYEVFDVPAGVELRTDMQLITDYYEVYQNKTPWETYRRAMISAYGEKNISIIGEEGSEINGQNCYDPQGEEHYRGPHAINMWYCKNIRLEGYTVRDSANWAHAIQNSENITARNLTVLGGHDGFDVRTCDHVLIEDSRFLTGDDGLAGFDNLDVLVRNCYYESACTVFRFGGTHVRIENCESRPASIYAFRGSLSDEEKKARVPAEIGKHRDLCKSIFLYYCDMRAVIRETPGDILIKDCHFGKSGKLFHLPFGHKWTCNRSLDNITYENCVFEDILDPIVAECPDNETLAITLKNCTVKARKGAENQPFLSGKNVRSMTLENVTTEGFDIEKIECAPPPFIAVKA